jgi:hypothetical protein
VDNDKLVTLNFGENEQVAYFARDAEITAHGKIDNISGMGVDLVECSLVG